MKSPHRYCRTRRANDKTGRSNETSLTQGQDTTDHEERYEDQVFQRVPRVDEDGDHCHGDPEAATAPPPCTLDGKPGGDRSEQGRLGRALGEAVEIGGVSLIEGEEEPGEGSDDPTAGHERADQSGEQRRGSRDGHREHPISDYSLQAECFSDLQNSQAPGRIRHVEPGFGTFGPVCFEGREPPRRVQAVLVGVTVRIHDVRVGEHRAVIEIGVLHAHRDQNGDPQQPEDQESCGSDSPTSHGLHLPAGHRNAD